MSVPRSGMEDATCYFSPLAHQYLWNNCVKCILAEWQIGFPLSTALDQFVEMTCSYFKKDFER